MTDIAVSKVHFHGQPVQEIIDIHFLLQVFQIRRVFRGIAGFQGFEQLFVFLIRSLDAAAIHGQDRNAVRQFIRYIFIPADGMAVSNDGAPIPAEVRKEIFVPFFTTKQSGSGIGLALSRQMMVMQGGDLTLSEPPITGFPVTFLLQLMREPSLESLS